MRPVLNARHARTCGANPESTRVAAVFFYDCSTGMMFSMVEPSWGSQSYGVHRSNETENFYIAMTPEELSKSHTHMEIHPCVVLGTMASNYSIP
jgi:hypothetical protein